MATMIDALVARYHPAMFQPGHAAEHARKARTYLGALAKVLNAKVPWPIPMVSDPVLLQGLIGINMHLLSTITDVPAMRKHWAEIDPNGVVGKTAEVIEAWTRAKGTMKIDPRMGEMQVVGTRVLPDGTKVEVLGFPVGHDLHPDNSMPTVAPDKKTAGAPSKTEADPWDEGYAAYKDEFALGANPYRPGKKSAKWKSGWLAARDETEGPQADPTPNEVVVGEPQKAELEPEAPPEAPPEPAFDEEVKLGMTGTQQSVQDYILGLNDVDLISQIRAGEESRVFTTKKARVYVLAALDARLEAIHDAA